MILIKYVIILSFYFCFNIPKLEINTNIYRIHLEVSIHSTNSAGDVRDYTLHHIIDVIGGVSISSCVIIRQIHIKHCII